jgi:DNA-binding GntR family transcriptional regulator
MGRISVIQPDTLRRKVENAVRQAIVSGVYAPGERLIERELCEGLGVSRASVREALRRLEAEKLVRVVPHKGPVVAAVSLEEARQLYALRGVLEGYAAHEFAAHAPDAAIADFARAADSLREAAASGDRDQVLRAKSALYDIMLGHCGNDLVREVLQGLFSRINLLRATSLMHPERLPHSLAEIDALTQAFHDRNPNGAQAAAVLHVTNAYAVALVQLQARPPEPASRTGTSRTGS